MSEAPEPAPRRADAVSAGGERPSGANPELGQVTTGASIIPVTAVTTTNHRMSARPRTMPPPPTPSTGPARPGVDGREDLQVQDAYVRDLLGRSLVSTPPRTLLRWTGPHPQPDAPPAGAIVDRSQPRNARTGPSVHTRVPITVVARPTTYS